MAESLRFKVPPSGSGSPLLGFLLESGRVDQDEIGRIMKLGGVFVNKRRVKDPTARLKVGDRIEIHPSDLTLRETANQAISLEILYQSPQVIIVNKPPGIPVSSTRQSDRGHLLGAVQGYVDRQRAPGGGFVPRVRLVHRLDREASGAIAFALSRESAGHLSNQIKERSASRTYIAIADGIPHPPKGTLEHHLKGGEVVDSGDGSLATSEYLTLSQGPDASLLQLTLGTGRFHQLRAQLKAAGWPVLGDKRYNPSERDKDSPPWLALHAWKLRLQEPISGTWVEAVATPPNAFSSAMQPLGLTLSDGASPVVSTPEVPATH